MKHPNIDNINFQHINLFLKRHSSDFYRESVQLSAIYASSDDPVPYSERKNLHYKNIAEGERWGGKWQSAWFELSGTVPESWQGKEVVLQLLFNCEAMLFDKNGTPVCLFSGGSIYDAWFNR